MTLSEVKMVQCREVAELVLDELVLQVDESLVSEVAREDFGFSPNIEERTFIMDQFKRAVLL